MACLVAMLCACLLLACETAGAPRAAVTGGPQGTGREAERLVITDGEVAGVSLATWTARWWQWANAQRIAPYMDPDGRFCGAGQGGPVWFLAGTDGSFNALRTCTVPVDVHVLLPVINMLYNATGDGPSNCAQLQAQAALNNEHLVSAVVLLDGEPVTDVKAHRVDSGGCFRLDPDDQSSPLAAADGYWLMLEPLPPGQHTIVVGANYGAPDSAYGSMRQNFKYVLEVGGPMF